MNLSFYSAAVGASMQLQNMGVVGNNVAHVNTYGYQAQVSGFENLMYGYIEGAEEVMSYRGAGTMLSQVSTNYEQAGFTETGRTFDFAISGDGFFSVYDPGTEEITFTRNGSFSMSHYLDEAGEESWRLADNSGRFVIDQVGNFIEIDPESDMLDHTVESLNVGLFDFQIRDGLSRNGPSGFMNIEKNGDIQVAVGEIHQGFLENSNVNLATEMSKLIEAQKMYSYALKMVITSDEIETTINGLSG